MTFFFQYRTLLKEQYGFDPNGSGGMGVNTPETDAPLREKFKRMPYSNSIKVDSRSHHNQKASLAFMEMPEGAVWQNVENIDDIEIIMHEGK